MDEFNINLAADTAEQVAETVADAVTEVVTPAVAKNGVTLPTGGAIALGVSGAAGAGILAYFGVKKAVAGIKDFREWRKLKKNGAVAKAEDAKVTDEAGNTETVEAEVIEETESKAE